MQIEPDRLLLGTVTRPPTEPCASAVPYDRLVEIAASFTPPGEVLSDMPEPPFDAQSESGAADILSLLARRPCSADDVVAGLGIRKVEAVKQLEALAADERIEAVVVAERTVFRLRRNE